MKKLILVLLFPFMLLLCSSLRTRHTARHLYWTDFSAFERSNPLGTTFAWAFAMVSYTLILMLINHIVGFA